MKTAKEENLKSKIKVSKFNFYFNRFTHLLKRTDNFSINDKIKSFQSRVIYRNFSVESIDEFEYFYKCEQEDVEKEIKKYIRKSSFAEYFPGAAISLIILMLALYYFDVNHFALLALMVFLYIIYYKMFVHPLNKEAISICYEYKKYLNKNKNRNKNLKSFLLELTTERPTATTALFDLHKINQNEILALIIGLKMKGLLSLNENLSKKEIINILSDTFTLEGEKINQNSFYNSFIRFDNDDISIENSLESLKCIVNKL